MLTGKTKEDFEKWYIEKYSIHFNFIMKILHKVFGLSTFYMDTLSEQYGVYVDFFDSVNYEIEINIEYYHFGWQVSWSDSDFKAGITIKKDREEARISAIESANIAYNNNHL